MSKKTKSIYFSFGLIGSVICQILFTPISAKMMELGYDILDLEFAWSSAKLDPILTAWKPILDSVKLFMLIDMFFPIFYFMTLNGWSVLLDFKENCRKRIFLMALSASIFDYIENIFTFITLFYPSTYVNFAPFIISLCATLKFLLILVVIIRNLVKMIFKK